MVNTTTLNAGSPEIPGMWVETQFGRRPITDFDEIEVHEMVADPNSPGGLWQATDGEEGSPIVAHSVFLHLHAGGIECVRDFCFDPNEPGARAQAEQDAEAFGGRLRDQLRATRMLRSIRLGES